jgi:hypothetical protein
LLTVFNIKFLETKFVEERSNKLTSVNSIVKQTIQSSFGSKFSLRIVGIEYNVLALMGSFLIEI